MGKIDCPWINCGASIAICKHGNGNADQAHLPRPIVFCHLLCGRPLLLQHFWARTSGWWVGGRIAFPGDRMPHGSLECAQVHGTSATHICSKILVRISILCLGLELGHALRAWPGQPLNPIFCESFYLEHGVQASLPQRMQVILNAPGQVRVWLAAAFEYLPQHQRHSLSV